MKAAAKPNQLRALTLIELSVVVAVVLILSAMVTVNLQRKRAQAARIKCVGNLKNVGLSFRVFANDHDDKYPYAARRHPMFGNETDVWKHFVNMSNELGSAKILMCPADRDRLNNISVDFSSNSVPPNFGLQFTRNSGVSYFIGLEADETKPQAMLAGDRSLETNAFNVSGSLLLFTSNRPPTWSPAPHGNVGNVCLSDGSVQFQNITALQAQARQALLATGLETNRLLMPW